MVKVITYGTFDLLHEGHINLLKRAKALGDYLLVGVTTENFDLTRGKVNVRQSLMERIEAVKRTGIADEVFPEEYQGQKIDDIKRHGVSVFAIGTDWEGQFDYLSEYCKVVYLPRTEGVSSSQLRSENTLRLGAVGSENTVLKLKQNAGFVNGVTFDDFYADEAAPNIEAVFSVSHESYESLLAAVDAVFVAARPEKRCEYVRQALLHGNHVICESPIALSEAQSKELFGLAKERGLVLFESIKTAYSVAFSRLVLLVKSGMIGEVKSVDVTCTSLEIRDWLKKTKYYSSFTGWGGFALLPVFKILGTCYTEAIIRTLDSAEMQDIYTKVNLVYPGALATVSVGIGVKSEGDLRISGTKGYVYVPSPWWKNGYFEVRFEDAKQNKPYFYENEGEGLRTELVHFLHCVRDHEKNYYMEESVSAAIASLMEQFEKQMHRGS